MFGLTPYRQNQVTRGNQDFFSLMDDFFNDDFMRLPAFKKSMFNSDSFKVDVRDQDEAYVVEADMPGVDKKDIAIDYRDNRLVIRVEQTQENESEDKNYLHRERIQSSMERSFYMKDVDESKIKAHMDNGVLTVELPKAADVDNHRRIDIE